MIIFNVNALVVAVIDQQQKAFQYNKNAKRISKNRDFKFFTFTQLLKTSKYLSVSKLDNFLTKKRKINRVNN